MCKIYAYLYNKQKLHVYLSALLLIIYVTKFSWSLKSHKTSYFCASTHANK